MTSFRSGGGGNKLAVRRVDHDIVSSLSFWTQLSWGVGCRYVRYVYSPRTRAFSRHVRASIDGTVSVLIVERSRDEADKEFSFVTQFDEFLKSAALHDWSITVGPALP